MEEKAIVNDFGRTVPNAEEVKAGVGREVLYILNLFA